MLEASDANVIAPASPRSFGVAAGRGGIRLVVGGMLTLGLLLVALFAPAIARQDPLDQDLVAQLAAPDWSFADGHHFLGADSLGRDLFARLVFGSRIAVVVALAAGSLTGLLGTALGVAAGFLEGWVDAVISRLLEIWAAFPPVLLSIVLVALVGTGLGSVILAIVIVDWTRFCRIVRAETFKQRGLEYVDAAVVAGMPPGAILVREILPNILPLALVLLTLEMGIAVVVEAILAFVGLGISSDAPSWGSLIAEGRQVVHQAPWVMLSAVAALLATVLGFNLLGDGLKRLLDPVLR